MSLVEADDDDNWVLVILFISESAMCFLITNSCISSKVRQLHDLATSFEQTRLEPPPHIEEQAKRKTCCSFFEGCWG